MKFLSCRHLKEGIPGDSLVMMSSPGVLKSGCNHLLRDLRVIGHHFYITMSSDSSISPASSGDERGSDTETIVAAALVRPYQNEPVTRGNRNPPPPPSREQKEKMERVGRIDW